MSVLAGAIVLLAVSLTAAFALAAGATPASPSPQTAVFKAGGSSSGWIDFTPYRNLGIYLPIRINGHEATAMLYGGASIIDKEFAATVGLPAKSDAAGPVGDLEVHVGDLTLRNLSAKSGDLQSELYGKIIGHPVTFWLGKEAFNRAAVEIDFAHHRVAFRDPKTETKPAGAVEVPLIELDGERVVPLAVDGGAPAQFELELGNMTGPLMTTPAYAQTHQLLDGHPTSQRLSGPYSETVVSIDHLNFAGVDFPKAPIALIPDTELPPASITGGVGLPLLSKFAELTIDYSRNRLYAIPNPAHTPIPKDRIGLIFSKAESDFAVVFVAPNSPAAAAGFKKGDKIALIDGKPFAAWPLRSLVEFYMADAGTTHTFTMADQSVRQVKAADFF